MDVSDDDELVVRFNRNHDTNANGAQSEENTNWMALHYEERMGKEKNAKADAKPRKPRPPKLKLNSHLLLGERGLPLLAKQCKGMKLKPKQGSEGLQLTLLLQMYDSWAKQLMPGQDVDQFYAKVEKLGNERAVKDRTELLIAGRNEADFTGIQTHTTAAEALIAQHNRSVTNRFLADDDDQGEVELEIEEMVEQIEKSSSKAKSSTSAMQVTVADINLPEGDYGAPEDFDEEFGAYDDDD